MHNIGISRQCKVGNIEDYYNYGRDSRQSIYGRIGKQRMLYKVG